ncbi:hypothetical protein ACFPLB_16955 [Aquamicrobium segne]|uniref:Uncharacterized protein n=1 Tax=Aquamicrobium segne TaxID=469547 RepID=A0ABW0H0Z5_9HYPH
MRGLILAHLSSGGIFSRKDPAGAGRMSAPVLSTKTMAKKTTATTV